MPRETEVDFQAILRVLAEHGVDFIVVGGVCGVLHGAPILTFDLDIVHSRKKDNVGRLMRALEALDARYRTHTEKTIRPAPTHLASEGHQLLATRFGPLDVLGLIGSGRQYEDLLPHSVVMRVGRGLTARLLDLDTLIETKQETAGEKDRAALAILRRIRQEESQR
ncbi:MAG TPA: hypothetical protein VLH09_03545 [Bryobacteraceae bacterium]|nr:hypothetical protein [Bryobacteraceae bacterium]